MPKTIIRTIFSFVVFSVFPVLAGEPWVVFEGSPAKPGSGKNLVLISGDEEYRSEETMLQLGKILSEHHGFRCTVLFAIDSTNGEINPEITDNIPGLEFLEDADLAIFNIRFRNLPDEAMKFIDDYLKSARPVIGLRTSTHAFNVPRDRKYAHYGFDYDGPDKAWKQGFGRLVLGETWISHHGKHGKEASRGIIVPEKKDHPVVRGCEDIFGPSDVYTVRLPLPENCEILVLGEVLEGMNPDDKPLATAKNSPRMPIAWLKTYEIPDGKKGRAFTTTMGSSQDLESEGLRRLLVNAVYSLCGLEKDIPERNEVGIIGKYEPTPMGFGKHKKGLNPEYLTN